MSHDAFSCKLLPDRFDGLEGNLIGSSSARRCCLTKEDGHNGSFVQLSYILLVIAVADGFRELAIASQCYMPYGHYQLLLLLLLLAAHPPLPPLMASRTVV